MSMMMMPASYNFNPGNSQNNSKESPRRTLSSGPVGEGMMAISLGDYSRRCGGSERHHSLLKRSLADVAPISHAGYLLKRSNEPYRELTPPPLLPEKRNLDQDFFLAYQPLPLHHTTNLFEEHLQFRPTVLNNCMEPASVAAAAPTAESVELSSESEFFISNFFGVELPRGSSFESENSTNEAKVYIEEQSQKKIQPKETISSIPEQQRSAPIRVISNNVNNDSEIRNVNNSNNNDDLSKPEDYIDPRDGHIWRAKYCVLAGETLYFYPEQVVAESQAAAVERQSLEIQCEEDETEADDDVYDHELSHSPLPRSTIYEKRVALKCVAAVRFAEEEHGPHSFELTASDSVKLILRAKNKDDMRTWLFKFHLCITSFVRDMVDHVVVPVLQAKMGDIHHPMVDHQPSSATTSTSVHISPRYHKNINTSTVPLSHGHGRNLLHRRRLEMQQQRRLVKTATPSPESSPIPFPMQQPPENSSRLVTPLQHAQDEQGQTPPEVCAPQSEYPETERPIPATGKYVPPHLRKNKSSVSPKPAKYVPPHLRGNKAYIPPHLRNKKTPPASERYVPRSVRSPGESPPHTFDAASAPSWESSSDDGSENFKHMKLGGCADPEFVDGSILDDRFIPRKASRLTKVRSVPFGYSSTSSEGALQWEIGAVSDCGIRESNEDSFLVSSNLMQAFSSINDDNPVADIVWNRLSTASHPPGLFAIFDGHCGDQASRFAAERLTRFIYEESTRTNITDGHSSSLTVERILRRAIHRLDEAFCHFCTEGGRKWESGSTAVIALLADEHLVIANLGDARGIMGRTITSSSQAKDHENEGWNKLPLDDYNRCDRYYFWKEVTDVHSPNREDERARIQQANGWVTTEQEIPVGQLQRMAFYDDDVVDILKRCFADRIQPSPKASAPHRVLEISRVCGELAVSRALGDRDFKVSHNKALANHSSCRQNAEWDAPHLFLNYPEGHCQSFVGDLISNKPDFETLKVGQVGVFEEFLLLACDGLWDVIDADDAYRVTRDLLFEKKWSAKKAAGRLAELAVHLGSSDNITVIVVRFFERT